MDDSLVIVTACFIDLERLNLSGVKAVLLLQDREKPCKRKCSKAEKIMGRKCDGIARDLGSPEEFAVSEERCQK
ncbi:hypothetical protein RclHR1_04920005 [Rhizophagus clarus]|uniref:Uncharacterized protein n=1 Tax=Rhizophagus clarus TaxID=94130 RepID=A0A2Z6RJV5_9GLOM|nr:hypothetical protein RclHR1_04920005 [Rhizophagus clarus]GES93143.1 hypothetical protein RCL_e19844_RclHR1_04920005 [Rhizophagus clarus]